MHVLIVTFQLRDLTGEAYQAQCEQAAPHFAALPGLITKIWLADPATSTYGGIYLWQNRQALEQYLVSDTFGSMAANSSFTNLRTRDFAVLDRATAATWLTRAFAPNAA